MWYALVLFFISWLTYNIFADKSLLRRLMPTIYFGIILALISDLLMEVIQLWKFNTNNAFETFATRMLVAFGPYFVVLFLFLQWLPQKRAYWRLFIYIFCWSGGSILLEFLFIKINWFAHINGWTLFYSYIADWLLFASFYWHFRWEQRAPS